MPEHHDQDRIVDRDHANDTRALTPLLLMAVAIACGFLFFALTGIGHAAAFLAR
jgi:hypothetical protein